MRLTPEQAEAVKNLQSNPDFRKFLGWIGDEAERANQLLIFNSDKDLREIRGRTQALVEMIKAIDTACKLK